MKKKVVIVSIITAFVLLFIASFLWNRNTLHKLRIAEHNVSAALDSIRYLRDVNGKLLAEKMSFITTVKDLKELNSEMYENIQSLKKEMRKQLISGANVWSGCQRYHFSRQCDSVYLG